MPGALASRYRIVGTLAAGGMGSVLLAVRRRGDETRPVALKKLHPHLADDPAFVSMFIDEARLASRIVHPNVVRVHDAEMIDDTVVLAMDFIEGASLSSLLREARAAGIPLPVGIALRIVHDALIGLHAAHELRDDHGELLRVVHRDVSPHNVLVGTDGTARITDFGVAKARGRIASTRDDGAVKGKLQYLAPEQVYRLPIDARTDVFAAGIVLWESLTGEKLFGADSEGETLARVLSSAIEPPSMHRPELTMDVDEVCLRALERDASRRFPDAASFAEALAPLGLASREDVAAVVERLAGDALREQRQWLAAASSTRWPIGDERADPVPSVTQTPRPSWRMPLAMLAVALTAAGAGAAATRMGARARATPETPVAVAASPPLVASTPPPVSSAPTAPSSPETAASTPSARSVDAGTPKVAGAPRRPPRRTTAPASSAKRGAFVPDDL